MATVNPPARTVATQACAHCDQVGRALRCAECFVGMVQEVIARCGSTAAAGSLAAELARIRLVLELETSSKDAAGEIMRREAVAVAGGEGGLVASPGGEESSGRPAAGSAMLQMRTGLASYFLRLSTVPEVAPTPPDQSLEARFGLTRKEARVAQLLAEGRPNKEIARLLFVSPHTARHHTQHLMLKLRARSRTAAAAMILGV